MKKTLLLIAFIALLSSCSKDDDSETVIEDITKKIELSFETENLDIGLITFSGSVFSVITNNNNVDFNVRSLEVYELNGDVLYSKDYNNDFIIVPKNGGEWLDGKYFNFALFPVIFKWTIVYNDETYILENTFKK